MRRRIKRLARIVVCLTLVTTAAMAILAPAVAHQRPEHDEDVEYVLFGSRGYKDSHPRLADKIGALEDAAYLCVDQFNGNGKEELARLRDRGVPDLPGSIAEIDFSSNYTHRSLTHRGWNHDYPEKSHWEARKRILTNTVEKELFSEYKTPLSWFPMLEGLVYGDDHHESKRDAMCELIYCVHVIGDHIEAGEDDKGKKTAEQKIKSLAYVNPLTRPNDAKEPGLIHDLESCLATLFYSQRWKLTYTHLMRGLDDLARRSDKLVGSKGGVDTPEEFEEYNKCARELLDLLAEDVPRLLSREEFFSDDFS